MLQLLRIKQMRMYSAHNNMISIDLIIIGIFLIITFSIGIYYGRGITTFQDYAVGSRKMSTTVILISLIATIYGGKILDYNLFFYYYEPWITVVFFLIQNPVDTHLFSRFVIIRMQEFLGHLSIAESMGSIYGPTVRAATGICGIIRAIALLAIQIKIGLSITMLLPEIQAYVSYSTVILALLFISYSTFGGVRSVALTDVYQFFLFTLCFPILFFALLYNVKDPVAGWQKLREMPQFNINQMCIWRWDYSLKKELFDDCIALFAAMFDPARMQRFYMAPSIQKSTKIFNRLSISRIVLIIVFFSISVALHVGDHVIKPNQNVLHYIIECSYFPGMRGILVTAIIALLMSTADSQLHVASVLFANDIWPIVAGSARHNKPSLTIVRMASLFIGIIGMVVGLHTTSIGQLVTKTIYIYAPAVTIPFLITCFGFRPRSAAVLCTMGVTTAIMVYRVFYKDQAILANQICFSLVLSAFILFVTHYVLPKRPHTGWVGIKDRSPVDLQNQATQRWWQERLQQLSLPFTQAYRKSLFPKKESTFILLGIHAILNSIVALCFMHKGYFIPYVYGYMALMAIGTTLVIYPAFHSYKKGDDRLLHLVWPALLFILLFVASIQLAKLGHFSPMVCALFIFNLGLGIVLLSLEVSIAMLCIALITHAFIPPSVPFWNLFLAGYKSLSVELVFAMILITVAIVGLGTYKYLRDKANAKLKIIKLRGSYERIIALEAIYNHANWSRLDMTYGSKLLQAIGEIMHGQKDETINLLLHKLYNFNDLLLRRVKSDCNLELNEQAIKPVIIELAILKVLRAMRDLGKPMQLLVRNPTKVTELLADPTLFECFLILNLWEISRCVQATDHIVTLTIADTALRYDYAIVNYAALTLPALAFFISTDVSTQNTLPVYDISDEPTSIHVPKTEKQFYQAESRQIVQAHGGYMELIETNEIVTCLYVLPLDGQKVMRFKTYDPADLVAGKLAETAESLAQEQELVELLTKETTLAKETVEKTITFIKNAHGLVSRKSGSPYYTHPMAVGKILLEVTKDPSTILAGLLHDVVEDTPITLNQIALMYGPDVASIVDMVTHYNTNGYPWKLDDKENKSILEQCKDIRVIEVKLADRLHNIRTLHARKLVDQKRIAQDTMTFYIPWGEKHNISKTWLEEMRSICKHIQVNM
ncbi:sodium:solute symporter family protein [Candidatus Cardinium hertigii]|uniref:HD domain-containing protein n=1 Tax=Candidatus Cardinium hertigii TaxID=247481 RepID=A0A3N2QC78_9BACT|nr:sodium:solute symporter family protein [Candidatus Cardinium hertigii]ROT47418.1 HD domain-containing protein [Candidatus Cardinium hertigii]